MAGTARPLNSDTAEALRQALEAAQQRMTGAGGAPLAPLPAAAHLAEMLSTAFWASLKQDEGRATSFSLEIVEPSTAGSVISFDAPIPLTVDSLARLSPAHDPHSRSLAVTSSSEGAFLIWGIVAHSHLSPQIQAPSPGTLVVRHLGEVVMTFEHGEVRFLQGAGAVNLLFLLRDAFRAESPFPEPFTLPSALLRLVQAMLRHRHGGTLLFVPTSLTAWERHLASIRYRPSPPSRILREAIDASLSFNAIPESVPHAMLSHGHEQVVTDVVSQLGLLTAVDGATIVNTDLELLAFGAMINLGGLPPEGHVLSMQPGHGMKEVRPISIESLGGTRHRSAADFCAQCHDAIACVASHDGPLTVLGWVSKEDALFAIQRADLFLV